MTTGPRSCATLAGRFHVAMGGRFVARCDFQTNGKVVPEDCCVFALEEA